MTMITFPPPHWRELASGHVTLAWPIDIVLSDGLFAGSLMPAVDMRETVGLHRATNPARCSQAKGPTSWLRGFSWRYLIRIGANLAPRHPGGARRQRGHRRLQRVERPG